MKYEKPEVVVLTTTTAAIQGHRKGATYNPDSERIDTQPAYEADE